MASVRKGSRSRDCANTNRFLLAQSQDITLVSTALLAPRWQLRDRGAHERAAGDGWRRAWRLSSAYGGLRKVAIEHATVDRQSWSPAAFSVASFEIGWRLRCLVGRSCQHAIHQLIRAVLLVIATVLARTTRCGTESVMRSTFEQRGELVLSSPAPSA